jgi:hypothetical protein
MHVGQRRVPTSFRQFSDEQSFFSPVSTSVVESPFAAIYLSWECVSHEWREWRSRDGMPTIADRRGG